MVHVVLPSALAEHARAAREVSVDVAREPDLRAVLDQLATMHPGVARRIRDETGELRRFVNVYVDSTESRSAAGLATRVAHGQVVRILVSVAGG